MGGFGLKSKGFREGVTLRTVVGVLVQHAARSRDCAVKR